MFPGGALGAFLTFYDSVIYPSYSAEPPVFGLSPLTDQILAGVLMWFSGIFTFVVPAVLITLRQLSSQQKTAGFSHS
jgi:putative membrane protein